MEGLRDCVNREIQFKFDRKWKRHTYSILERLLF